MRSFVCKTGGFDLNAGSSVHEIIHLSKVEKNRVLLPYNNVKRMTKASKKN